MPDKNKPGKICKISGPLVVAEDMSDVRIYDMVSVSDKRLIGEIIELKNGKASIQVYEDTSGIRVGDLVYPAGEPMTAELAPGLIEGIFDGIQRPLTEIYKMYGAKIPRGFEISRLDRNRKWIFSPCAKIYEVLTAGAIIGTVQETEAVVHKIMLPPDISGKLVWINSGKASITDTIAKIQTSDGSVSDITMLQKWPIRKMRPYVRKLNSYAPMITGQRIVDSLFPIADGGVAAIPGPFGSGKTMLQHQFAKWAEADIIIYIGCGERGNEMTDVLKEFPELTDPKTGLSIMKRTVLIANTSDMPVAAREASIYTGITIAEYFRDMGYKTAIIADSTSRWAEALREMSGRLEEMPGDEGYPAYLGTRLAEFYERAGIVQCLGNDKRTGSITAVGAVSPPGGDTSEPVSQATLKIVKVFWGLSSELAYKRHFPAINWLKSYSLYEGSINKYFDSDIAPGWSAQIREVKHILQKEAELNEIVQLIGFDSLGQSDILTLECARIIREDFLQQDAYREVDTYTSPKKQFDMLYAILLWYNKAQKASESGVKYTMLTELPSVQSIAKMKYIDENDWEKYFYQLKNDIDSEISALCPRGEKDEKGI